MSVDEFGRTRVNSGEGLMDIEYSRGRRRSVSIDRRLGDGYRSQRSVSPPRGDEYDSYHPDYSRNGYRPGPRVDRYESDHYRGERDRDLVDPAKLDHIVPFRYFADWLRSQGKMEERPRPTDSDYKQRYEDQTMRVHMLYEDYKRSFQSRLNRVFFDCHKDEEWMLERYNTNHTARRMQRITAMKQANFVKFTEDLDAGRYDNINLDEPSEELNIEDYNDPDFLHRRDQMQRTVFIKSIPVNYKREEVEQLLSKFLGYEYLAISEPRPPTQERGFTPEPQAPIILALASCVGWAVFDTLANAQEAHKQLSAQREQILATARQSMINEAILGETSPLQFLNTGFTETMPPPRLRTTTISDFSTAKRMAMDLEKLHDITQRLDDEAQITNGVASIEARISQLQQARGTQDVIMIDKSTEPSNEDRETVRIALDFYLTYIRRVHMYCYYSGGVESDSFEELTRRCGDKMFRRRLQPDNLEEEADKTRAEAIFRRLYEKIDQRFAGLLNSTELAALGGYVPDEYVDEFLRQFVQREDESRFRCDYQDCKKLFREEVYVIKHLKNKHPELEPVLEEKLAYVQYFNSYLSDPHRVTPKEASLLLTPSTALSMVGQAGRESAPYPLGALRSNGSGGRFGSTRSGGRFNPYSRQSDGANGGMRNRGMPEDPRAGNIRAYDDLDAPKEIDVQLRYD